MRTRVLDQRPQPGKARGARLARLDTELCELTRCAIGLVVADDDRPGETAGERRPGRCRRRARIETGHRRPGRLDRDRTARRQRCCDARGTCGVHRDRRDPAPGGPAHAGARERADACLQQHDVDRRVGRKLCVDLAEQRRVAVDHPAADRARAVEIGIVDRAAGRVARGVGERSAHRLVVALRDDDELGALRRDGLAPGGAHRLGDVDRGAQTDERRHARDGPPMVAVRRRREALDALLGGGVGELVGVRAAAEQPRDRPRRAQELERRQAEPTRLVLDPDRVEAELACKRAGFDEWRLRVAGQRAVERERVGMSRRRDSRVARPSGHLAGQAIDLSPGQLDGRRSAVLLEVRDLQVPGSAGSPASARAATRVRSAPTSRPLTASSRPRSPGRRAGRSRSGTTE